MEELIKLVVKKTGISEEQAKKAIETVVGFLKTKLPAPIAGQLDGALKGEGASGIAAGLGNLLGGKK